MRPYERIKRLIDIVGAAVGLVFFSPALLLTAVYIKLVSSGPVFADMPKRVGRGGLLFRMFKFRSMIPNAHEYLLKHPKLYEQYRQNSYKLPPKEDPRLIRGGRFLRKSSIDEWPQLINVLKGEMSLVGPRAYYPFELEEQRKCYPDRNPLIDKVLSIKPGLTGLWQVSGRSEISFPKRIELDATYADQRSLLCDLRLILRTPWAVISGRGGRVEMKKFQSYYRKKGRPSKKRSSGGRVRRVVLVLVLVGVFLVGPVARSLVAAQQTRDHLRYLKDGFLLSDLDQIKNALSFLEEDLVRIRRSTWPLFWVRPVPYLGSYYADAQSLLKAGELGVQVGQEVVEAVYPAAVEIGFKTAASPAQPLAGQERVMALVDVFSLVAARMDELEPKLREISDLLTRLHVDRYPRSVGGVAVRSQIQSLHGAADFLAEADGDVRALLEVLPGILGSEGTKKYLILFQNDKELRPTGGFWTAYAILTLEDGKIVGMAQGDMYFLDIDKRAGEYPPAPAVIKKYLKLDDWFIRDTNLSPDYKESVETMKTFWARVPDVPTVDGVIALDTQFVQGLLEVLGEISIPGYDEPFTSENVVYQLELYANLLGSQLEKRGGRKNILGVLMQEVVSKTFALPMNEYDSLLSKVWQLASRKHLLLYFESPEEQQLAEHFNLAGRIKDYEGDYLHVNDANFGGRKANWYVTESVTQEIKISRDRVVKTVTIDYDNTGEYHSEWNTGYRDYVRIYVPAGAQLLESSGSQDPVQTFEDLNKTVFSAFMAVNPLQTAQLQIKYEFPREVAVKDGRYRLLIQKQPGKEFEPHKVVVNGKTIAEVELRSDQEFSTKP